jgi:hypothetical protein
VVARRDERLARSGDGIAPRTPSNSIGCSAESEAAVWEDCGASTVTPPNVAAFPARRIPAGTPPNYASNTPANRRAYRPRHGPGGPA